MKIAQVLFAVLEFAATVLFGAILYLWCAVYFAVCVYTNELHGLFMRAVATWRLRVQVAPIALSASASALSRSAAEQSADRISSSQESPQCGPVGRGRFESWLN